MPNLVAFGRTVYRPYPQRSLYIGVVARGDNTRDTSADIVHSLPVASPSEAIFCAHALRGILLEQEF